MDPEQIKQEAETVINKVEAEVKTVNWRKIILWACVGIFALAGAIVAYKSLRPAPKPVTAPQIAPEAPKAIDVPKVTIAGPKRLQVYDKKKLAAKVALPAQVAENPQIQATSTADIKPSPYGGTAVAYTNMSTGVSGISYQAKPRPLFELGGKTTIGALAGVTTKGESAIMYGNQDVLRVGPVQIGAAAGGGVIGGELGAGAFVNIHGQF